MYATIFILAYYANTTSMPMILVTFFLFQPIKRVKVPLTHAEYGAVLLI